MHFRFPFASFGTVHFIGEYCFRCCIRNTFLFLLRGKGHFTITFHRFPRALYPQTATINKSEITKKKPQSQRHRNDCGSGALVLLTRTLFRCNLNLIDAVIIWIYKMHASVTPFSWLCHSHNGWWVAVDTPTRHADVLTLHPQLLIFPDADDARADWEWSCSILCATCSRRSRR